MGCNGYPERAQRASDAHWVMHRAFLESMDGIYHLSSDRPWVPALYVLHDLEIFETIGALSRNERSYDGWLLQRRLLIADATALKSKPSGNQSTYPRKIWTIFDRTELVSVLSHHFPSFFLLVLALHSLTDDTTHFTKP